MASPYVVACSHCEAKLKLKDDSLAGKKIRCPKCQEIFVVGGGAAKTGAAGAAAKKKAKPKDDFDFSGLSEDDYEPPPGAEGEEAELDELPQSPVAKRKASAKSGGKKKKRASSGPGFGRIALIGAVVLVGIGLVGGVGYGIYAIVQGLGGGAGRFAWLPEDTEFVVEVRVSEAWNSGVVEPLRNGELGKTISEKMKGDTKLDPNRIDRVIVGSKLNSKTPVVVVYANSPIDQTDVKQGATASSYGGYEVYSKGPQTMFFPDASTLVLGPDANIKAAIDRQGVCPVADRFAHMPTRGQLIFAADKITKPQGPAAGMFNTSGVDPEKLSSLSASVSLSNDIGIEFSCVCPDTAMAEQLVQSVEKEKAEGLAKLQEQKVQMESNPLLKLSPMAGLMSGAEKSLESYHVSSSGATVTGGITVPGKLLKDAAEAVGPMMQMMMQQLPSSGMGGGGFTRPPATRPGSESDNVPQSEGAPASPHDESP